jgi:hypothetical protein
MVPPDLSSELTSSGWLRQLTAAAHAEHWNQILSPRHITHDPYREQQDAPVTYQIVYSSHSTFPMQSDALEELLEHARSRNADQGISGALIYTEGVFLQILEGERANLEALMAKIRKDVRHQSVTVLREGEIAEAKFSSWKMAYVAATPEQVAQWSGIGGETGSPEPKADAVANLHRTARFVRDILALLASGDAREPAREADIDAGSGAA